MNIEQQQNDGKSIDILLVEDDECDVELTLRAFGKIDFKNNIYVVRNGQEALDFVYHQGEYQDKEKYPRPDLMLLDINMPKMTGLEVLKELKAKSEYKSIPMIMLTSSKNDADVTQCYDHGANSYIPKPIDYKDFVQIVEGFNFYWHVINKLSEKS